MDFSALYRLPEFFGYAWEWTARTDPRLAFASGVVFTLAVKGVFSIFANPLQKALAVVGFLLVLTISLLSWIGFSGGLAPGEIPFHRAAETPNVDTLQEIQQ